MEDPRTQVGMQIGQGVKFYLMGLGVVGVVLIVGAAVWEWGGWAYGVGGLLVFAGFGSLVANRFKVGWQPALGPCPACETQLHYVTKKQFLRCPKCEALLEVSNRQLSRVDPVTVADRPVFPVPFPEEISFPEKCTLCGSPPIAWETTEFEKAESKGLPGVAAVIKTQKFRLQFPVCQDHQGSKAVVIDYGDHPTTTDPQSTLSLKFRSLAMLESFRQYNQDRMPVLENKPMLPHAPKAREF